MSELAQGFSDGHSIYGSQETSCIKRKGFIWFFSYDSHEYSDEDPSCGVLPSRQRLVGGLSIPRALPPVTQGSALQAPECLWILMTRYPPGSGVLARYYDETDNI